MNSFHVAHSVNEHVLLLVVAHTIRTVHGIIWKIHVQVEALVAATLTNMHVKLQPISVIVQVHTIQLKIGIYFLVLSLIIKL